MIQEVPSFRKVSELLHKDGLVKKDVVELLHWVLIEQEHQLVTVPKEMVRYYLSLIFHSNHFPTARTGPWASTIEHGCAGPQYDI